MKNQTKLIFAAFFILSVSCGPSSGQIKIKQIGLKETSLGIVASINAGKIKHQDGLVLLKKQYDAIGEINPNYEMAKKPSRQVENSRMLRKIVQSLFVLYVGVPVANLGFILGVDEYLSSEEGSKHPVKKTGIRNYDDLFEILSVIEPRFSQDITKIDFFLVHYMEGLTDLDEIDAFQGNRNIQNYFHRRIERATQNVIEASGGIRWRFIETGGSVKPANIVVGADIGFSKNDEGKTITVVTINVGVGSGATPVEVHDRVGYSHAQKFGSADEDGSSSLDGGSCQEIDFEGRASESSSYDRGGHDGHGREWDGSDSPEGSSVNGPGG